MFNKIAVTLLVALFGCLSFGVSADDEPITIGSFYQCAHGLRGKIWVKNDREMFIEGFNYDGKGPAAWFHGQLKSAKSIQTSDPSSYETLPFPGGSCDRLSSKVYKDDNVTLILPRSIKDFKTIGIFCYQYCHNFGHIVIPEDLSVPPAPDTLEAVSTCDKPNYKTCETPRHNEIKPDCAAGASHSMIPSTSAAAQFTFISGWFIFSLFLSTRSN